MGRVSQCPHCSSQLADPRARYCARCGGAITPATSSGPPPVHLAGRGSLWNAWFFLSAVILITGGLLAGFGQVLPGGILLAVGVPVLLIVTVRSLSR